MRIRPSALLAAGALWLFAAPAGAQDIGIGTLMAGPPVPPEEIIVRPPPHAPERGDLGGPVIDVAMSRAVRYDDLDLSSPWGVRWLNWRVRAAAMDLCTRLNEMYPVGVDSNRDSCYRNAVAEAMHQVRDAVSAQAQVNYTPDGK